MSTEPYRKLFPFGLLCGATGVALWVLFFRGVISYPIQAHSYLMILGLFLSFVSGFLMTALPRMTGGPGSTKIETALALVSIGGGALAALFGLMFVAYFFATLQFVGLAVFALRRAFGSAVNLPRGFMFVPVALAWGAFGAAVMGLRSMQMELPDPLISLGRLGLQQAFLLNLIIGLGSRLIPFISRTQSFGSVERRPESMIPALLILIFLNGGFIAEGIFPGPWAHAERAILLLTAGIWFFSILKKPAEWTCVGLAMSASVWAMISSYVLMAIWPAYSLAWSHILFIAGYMLLTIIVATRVTLAHGGKSLQAEKRSLLLISVFVLILAAAALRALSIIVPAALVLLTAMGLWMWGIGRPQYDSHHIGK